MRKHKNTCMCYECAKKHELEDAIWGERCGSMHEMDDYPENYPDPEYEDASDTRRTGELG